VINIKIFALTPIWFLYAVVIGLLIAIVIVYGAVPHPVETPIQVITPVSTPYSVVLTEHPTEVPIEIARTNTVSASASITADNIIGFTIVFMIVLAAPFVLFLGLEVGKGMRKEKTNFREIISKNEEYKNEMRKMRR
jgi:hypothetical protein